jgi:23S rRNA (uracil1939-C5)-methyltransferase
MRLAAARTSSKSGIRVTAKYLLSVPRDPSHHTRVSVHETLPPGCEPACHGCRHRHLAHAASLAQKAGYLTRVLAPWSNRLQPVRAVAEADRLGYRDRVTLNAAWDSVAGWRIGLMRRDELIAIPTCPVHSGRVNACMSLLRTTLPPAAQLPLAYVHVAGAQATLIVKAHRFTDADLDGLRVGLPATGLEGCWVHCHPSAGRKLFARSGWHHVWGRPVSFDDAGLEYGPTAFRQLLPSLHAAAMDAAATHLGARPGVAVLDLYCGIGATLRRWTGDGAAALGVELAGGAVSAAQRNAPAARVLRGTCVQRLPQINEWWAERGNAVARGMYVNPPRSGLETEITAAVIESWRPRRIAYLSCSAGTLARDLALLVDAGYRVDALLPFDFFPLTHHVECLALLTRASA